MDHRRGRPPTVASAPTWAGRAAAVVDHPQSNSRQTRSTKLRKRPAITPFKSPPALIQGRIGAPATHGPARALRPCPSQPFASGEGTPDRLRCAFSPASGTARSRQSRQHRGGLRARQVRFDERQGSRRWPTCRSSTCTRLSDFFPFFFFDEDFILRAGTNHIELFPPGGVFQSGQYRKIILRAGPGCSRSARDPCTLAEAQGAASGWATHLRGDYALPHDARVARRHRPQGPRRAWAPSATWPPSVTKIQVGLR